jgi:hypothetical protein
MTTEAKAHEAALKRTLQKAKQWSAGLLADHIRERFPAPAYACLEQVRNGTGYAKAARTADAVAMGLWPSRGIDVHGMEIKVSRSDWKAELKQPHKAHEIQQYCDYWWVVAPSVDVVPLSELPQNWGLLIPHGKSLRAAKEAPKLEPASLDRLFVASVLRNVRQLHTQHDLIRSDAQTIAASSLRAELRAELAEQHRTQINAERAQHDQQIQAMERRIADFERASGVQFDRFQAGKIGAAVRFIVGGHMGYTRRALRKMIDELRVREESLQHLWEELEDDAAEVEPHAEEPKNGTA